MNEQLRLLARCLYNAYFVSAGGVNHLGADMPRWDDLPSITKMHWVNVAREALARLR
jgi:hypothetical protein